MEISSARSRKRDLEDPAAHVDLHQVDQVLLKGVRPVARRIEFDLRARQQAVDRTYEIGADGVEVRRRRLAEGRNLPRAAQKALVLLGERVDVLGEPLQAGVPCQRLVCDASHHTSLAATARFPQFFRMNQMQNVDLQTAEHLVGLFHGKQALSFQYVVEMGLGNSGKARESAFGGGSAAHPLAEFVEEALLQFVECHWLA